MKSRIALVMLCVLTGCSGTDSPGIVTVMVPPLSLSPGTELTRCVSITLDNDAPLHVARVDFEAGSGWHHSNWYFVGEDDFAGPDGVWPCEERGFEDPVTPAVRGGVLFAQSTGAARETQALADGAAIRIPARAKLVAQIHLLNAGDAAFDTDATLTLGTIEAAEVSAQLVGMAGAYYPLALPPRARSRFEATCDLRTVAGGDPDITVHHVLAHYHALGTGMRLAVAGGPDDGQVIFETGGAVGENLGATLAAPVSLARADGFRFGCSYDNPGDQVVVWGPGQAVNEMCVFFALVESDWMYAAGVLDQAGSDVVDGVTRHEGRCQVAAFNVLDSF